MCGGSTGATVTDASSSLAISISLTDASGSFTPRIFIPPAEGFVEQAVDQSVASECNEARCVIAPGATLTASSTPPLHMYVGVAVNATATLTATGIAADWVADKLQPGTQLERKVAQCGEDTQQFLSSTNPNDSVREALRGGVECHSLYDTVAQDLNGETDDTRDSHDALDLANRFTDTLHSDFADIAVVDLLDHFH